MLACRPSTLENWVREFERFAPEVEVQTYYGSQPERAELRDMLYRSQWDVLVTTYNFAHGNEFDRKFFKKTPWRVCSQWLKRDKHIFRLTLNEGTCLRRRPHVEELPEPALPAAYQDSGDLEGFADRHSCPEQSSRACGATPCYLLLYFN